MEGWKKEKEEERRVNSRSTEINLCLKKIVRMLRNTNNQLGQLDLILCIALNFPSKVG